MILEYFKMALQSLHRRRMRSWLTMIGIFIGIAAVVSLISLGQGMQQAITAEFEAIGSDKLFIQPKSTFGVFGDNVANSLTDNDVEFIKRQSGVLSAGGYTIASVKVEYQNTIRYFSAMGIETKQEEIDLFSASFFDEISSGEFFEPGDKTVSVLGIHHSNKGLYDGDNLFLNSKFTLNDNYTFRVKGFLAPFGNNDDDRWIVLPMNEFREVTGVEERIDQIFVQVDPNKNPTLIADELTRSLGRYRGVKEGKEDFQIQTPDDLLESFNTILNIIQLVLTGIAAISLFVGSIGIMNTMYTSVIERKKDIGIMKAIGAKNSDIRLLFLVESAVLGFIGGLLGIAIGVGLAKSVEILSRAALDKTYLIAYLSWELFAIALAISTVIGALAGTLPAIQASKLQPVETLRDE